MYSYIFFGLMMVCGFLIIESFKNFRIDSLLKNHFLCLLILQFIANYLSFSNEIGHSYSHFFTINKIIISIVIVNILIIIVDYKISIYIYLAEFVFILLYFIFVLNGFYFVEFKKGYLFPLEQMQFQALLSFAQAGIFLFLITTYLFRIVKKTTENNLYYKKVRIWSLLFLLFLLFSIIPFIYAFYIYYFKGINQIAVIDSRNALIIGRSLLLLFILLRPRFLNESGFSVEMTNYFNRSNNQVSDEKFNFLFFSNHYYLNTEGNLEDFSLKMNLSKSAINDFVYRKSNSSFVELLNQYRISYMKELLEARKYNEFTIEALSEMSGFSNRRTMYNAFKKSTGITPTEFIQRLK